LPPKKSPLRKTKARASAPAVPTITTRTTTGSLPFHRILDDLLTHILSSAAAAFIRLPAGKTGPELPVDRPTFQRLFTAAAAADHSAEVWTQADSELLVFTGKVQADLQDGLVLVRIPVSCDQASATIEVPFAVGSKDRPAGMVAATEASPRGPDAIVQVWGESLTAFAWRTLLKLATQAAWASGLDEDGAGLIPVALSASPDQLRILTMARHTFDRVRV
jgi:hypothetical protein